MYGVIVMFVYGLVFGSYFYVVGVRLPQNKSTIKHKSSCASCHYRIYWYDLIPLISYLFLKGKCRHCQKRISNGYFYTELITGFLFVFAYIQIGFQIELLLALTLISLCVILTVTDLLYLIIPNRLLIVFSTFFIPLQIFISRVPLRDALFSSVLFSGILLLFTKICKGGIGGGDIKLFIILGFIFGTLHTFLTLLIASFIGTIIGLVVIIVFRKNRKTPIPFGPSISLAAIVIYFYGQDITTWYLQLFSFVEK